MAAHSRVLDKSHVSGKSHVLGKSRALGKLALALLAGGILTMGMAGCATRSNPADSATNPQNLEFSNIDMEDSDYAPPYQRSGPVVSDLQVFNKIQPGTPAAQVKTLLGAPLTQTDGKLGEEWDYNFTLALPNATRDRLVCQYKVVFDDQQQVKEALWRRRQCPRAIAAAKPKPAPAPVVRSRSASTVFTLHILFGFDQWQQSGIHQKGLDELQTVVDKLNSDPVAHRTIIVKGYAGPQGSAAYNLALSMRRARTVRSYLLDHGVQAERIEAQAFGDTEPVVADCDADSSAAKAACYAADRRVVIVAQPGL